MKLYIKTFGCQMNTYDSARIRDMLAVLGYTETDVPNEADIILLNTCHIREKASEKLFSEIGRLVKLKKENALLHLWLSFLPPLFLGCDFSLCYLKLQEFLASIINAS